MQIANFVSRIIKAPLGDLPVMTNRQCVRVATDIGKDLVDISRTGAELSDDVIVKTVHKHLPCIPKPKILSDEHDVEILAKNKGLDHSEILNRCYRLFIPLEADPMGPKACYMPQLKAICLPTVKRIARDPEVIAHELEHYFSAIYSITGKKRKFMSKIRNMFKNNQQSKPPAPPKESPLHHIQKTIFERFGTFPEQISKLEGIPSTEDGVRQVLASDLFLNMGTDKRIDAYLRAIYRSYVNPLAVNTTKAYKMLLADEARAYTVSDNVIRYRNNIDGLTRMKIRSSLLDRLCKMLDGEISLGKQYKIGIRELKRTERPGLPSEIYVG